MLRNEKGITILILTITIILMVILAGATINYGVNSLNAAKFQNFSYELQQIQGKVDSIYEKIKLGDESYIILGNEIKKKKKAMNTLNMVKGINYLNILDSQRDQYYYQENFSYYRYLTEDNLENIFDITSNPGDVIINFTTREVISVDGFEYEGRTYYTLSELN